MRSWYVELQAKEPVTFGREAVGETEEEAVNAVLMMAPGSPSDWEVIIVQPGLAENRRV